MNALMDSSAASRHHFRAGGGSRAWSRRETAWADIGHFPVADGGIALCVTVYNEPVEALRDSLAGLAAGVAFLRRTHPGIAIDIVVLVDGLSKCSPSMAAAIEEAFAPEPPARGGAYDLACVECGFDALAGTAAPRCSDSGTRLFVAAKVQNRGKLDSHWWFYRVFCSHFNPAYCFQMDVGTVPAEQALHAMVERFEQDRRIGAVASSILPPAPGSAWNLLECWQYMSFANSVLMEWPAESASGYLSVVPGQLSAMRWAAIDDRGLGATRDDPLEVYFKGLGQLTPYESMLYAAEDRVLCREIVNDPEVEWTISHVDGALAETDPCRSWDELLRQRKRWCNGFMACRVNFVAGLPDFVRRPEVPLRRKSRSAVAGVYHSLVLLNDWFMPGLSILFLYSLVQYAVSLLARMPLLQGGLGAVSGIAAGALLAQFVLCYRGSLSARSIGLFRVSLALQASVAAASLSAVLLLGRTALLSSLLVFVFAAWPLASLIGQRRLTRTVLASTPIAALTFYIVTPLIWMYAVCNAHDNSWGTKGLVAAGPDRMDPDTQGRVRQAGFRRFRNRYVATWFASNLLLVLAVRLGFGTDHASALAAVVGVNAAVLLFGLACRTGARIGELRRRAAGAARPVRAAPVAGGADPESAWGG